MAGKYTEAQKRATKKYKSSKKRIELYVSPEDKEKYKELAKRNNMGLSEYVIYLLELELTE